MFGAQMGLVRCTPHIPAEFAALAGCAVRQRSLVVALRPRTTKSARPCYGSSSCASGSRGAGAGKGESSGRRGVRVRRHYLKQTEALSRAPCSSSGISLPRSVPRSVRAACARAELQLRRSPARLASTSLGSLLEEGPALGVDDPGSVCARPSVLARPPLRLLRPRQSHSLP